MTCHYPARRQRNPRDIWEITVKIGLEKVNTKERISVKALLDSGITDLVISSEFAKKHSLKLNKIEKPIYVRNINIFSMKKDLLIYSRSEYLLPRA